MIVFIDGQPPELFAALNLPPDSMTTHLRDALDVRPEALVTYNINTDALPPLSDDMDAIFIGGSLHMVNDGNAWQPDLEAWVHKIIERGIPLFGYCFGHQTIAHAFGATVDVDPHGREFGLTTIAKTAAGKEHYLFEGLTDSFVLPASHKQSVLTTPEGATLLAEHPLHAHHALSYNDRTVSLQGEFAYDVNWMQRLGRYRKDKYIADGFITTDADLERIFDDAIHQRQVFMQNGRTIARNFLRHPVRICMESRGRRLDDILQKPDRSEAAQS